MSCPMNTEPLLWTRGFLCFQACTFQSPPSLLSELLSHCELFFFLRLLSGNLELINICFLATSSLTP